MQAIRSRIPDIPESNVRDARKERDEEYISIENNRICPSLPYYHASPLPRERRNFTTMRNIRDIPRAKGHRKGELLIFQAFN